MLTSQQPMFVWWGSDLINLYNDAYRAILGGKHPRALGQPAPVVWQEIWDQVGPRAENAIARNQGTYDQALFLMMERNGYPEETYYTFSYSPIPNDEGETFGIFCANTDETQRILSARRMATQRELAARTTDAFTVSGACESSLAALATNPHDFPFALLYLKRPGSETPVYAGPANSAFGNADLWPIDEVLSTSKAMVMELPRTIKFPSGAWERSPDRAALLPINPSGQVGYSAVLVAGLNPHSAYEGHYEDFLRLIAGQIASALTSARAYEEERKRAETLEQLDRAKTTFFANISHEFRTPLTLMLGPVEDLLARQEEGPAEGRPASQRSADRVALETVHRNATRLQKLVNALLDFSRIEAGRMSANFQATDLALFTRELASAFDSAMTRAGLRFTVACEPLRDFVSLDRDMWEKVVFNLLSNALKYTFQGGVEIRVRENAGQAELSVSDTGIGIPKAELPRLFERFHRVAGARGRTYEGTGIGLALVQELVRMHGGSVTASSELDKGSTFRVHLPFRAAGAKAEAALEGAGAAHAHTSRASEYVEEALGWLPEADKAAAPPESGQGTLASASAGGSILLVDDNADMRGYVQRLLADEFEVMATANGRQALELLAARENAPDLVISDIMMPEMDGFALLKELRANPVTRSIPFVFLSARAGQEASVEGLEAGADDYIVKPFTARELLARVRGTLMIHRERRQVLEQLNQLFEQSPVAICVFRKPDLVFELANSYYHQLVRGRKIIGKKLNEVIPTLPPHVWKALHQVIDDGEPYIADEWYVPYDPAGDGQIEDHWFNVAYHPFRNADKSIRGAVCVVYDITKQVLARREVERVNRELEEFAYVASHDLQEPLRMVNAYSQLLVKRLENSKPEQLQQYVDFIGTGVRRMEELIRDLLSFARTVQSDAPVLAPVRLAGCLEKALQVLSAQIEEKRARIEIGELPVVMGDETQLPQVFQNLISNALKYSKPESVPEIRISGTHREKEWTISVQDNGIGFKQDYAEHIFGLFKRLHRDEFLGTGLGLAICKRIIERFGGRIWAESAPGAGSTFSFTLAGEG
jgi:signal transduction histidine kinase/DNA-binding NarL/FixJ family response regulator